MRNQLEKPNRNPGNKPEVSKSTPKEAKRGLRITGQTQSGTIYAHLMAPELKEDRIAAPRILL
jgi:hypothetical protein